MVICEEKRVFIDTYPSSERNQLPMFAENRVHQRTSGNPYPNKVVLTAQREIREPREYTLITLENEYLEIGILPELGGKIYYATDKKNGYDFFYKNNVVKPALIGMLGSWCSGGVEFNWPFHHRASTFMPVDYLIERGDNYATVWLSEHDPTNRMKGMVGVTLKDGECIFETTVKLDNTTPLRQSFLWWENAAVPVNESYEIFFPEDVNFVRFHYKRSVTTYPIANNSLYGAYNGIYYDGDTDISKHKNTRPATSYFSAESMYDYFGGYDNSKKAGVVHVADRHISPGKKMFTWAYRQLAKTWERALTDNDGQYAELMAGCYSDNQPDLTWLAPYETKSFSQRWFPIHDLGAPTIANENGALYIKDGKLFIGATRAFSSVLITVKRDGEYVFEASLDIPTYDILELCPIDNSFGTSIIIKKGKATLFSYEIKNPSSKEIPPPRSELPYFKEVKTAEELYLEALHIEQYRSPDYSAERCYLEALERDAEFTSALLALSELNLRKNNPSEALSYAERAESVLSRFNTRHESGRCYYLKGLSLLALEDFDLAYSYLYRSAWCYDYKSAALFHIGLLDIKNENYERAIYHFKESSGGSSRAVLARAFLFYAYHLSGNSESANQVLAEALSDDKLNIYAIALSSVISKDYASLTDLIKTDINELSLDICEYLAEAGLYNEIRELLNGISLYRPLTLMTSLALFFADENTSCKVLHSALTKDVGIAFPSRMYERKLLERAIALSPDSFDLHYLYGCLLYGKGLYEDGIKAFERAISIKNDYRALRALAMGYYSHRKAYREALELMKKASELSPRDEQQITFEYSYLMAKSGCAPREIIDFILSRDNDRDDITVELARAYNHNGEPDLAIKLLLGRSFVACEGGEHYIADEYMYAYYLKGKDAWLAGDFSLALSFFRLAQELPRSLGSGLWNELKLVPYKYFEAKCLDALGEHASAKEIYKSFGKYRYDYFTDMYLYTFAYYSACALRELSEKDKARALIEEKRALWLSLLSKETLGYFGTTPFFIGFIDDPERAKAIHFAYPLYLASSFLGENTDKYKALMLEDGYSLYIEDFTV